MEVATFMNIHNNPELVMDTIESIRRHMTHDILVVKDGASLDNFKNVRLPFSVDGFPHGHSAAPYRNVALGAKLVVKQFPRADWYCYMEPDCLVGNDDYRYILRTASDDLWVIGNDHRKGMLRLAMVDRMIGANLEESHYLLGCCVFYRGEFFRKLRDLDFFNKFLTITNGFEQGFYPKFHEYDLSEHLYPSIAVALGGRVLGVAVYAEQVGEWVGTERVFHLRFRPDLEAESHDDVSLMHPIKQVDHPARVYHKGRRERGR